MPQFRKKPVVIEAIRLPSPEDDNPHEFHAWCDRVGFTNWTSERDATLAIPTLEGTMIAQPGDWIIKGVAGEFYPCKPDIFAKTYEPALKPARLPRLAIRKPVRIDGDTTTGHAMVETLVALAKSAGLEKPQIWALLDQWEANRVRLMLEHEVPFSLECAGGECGGTASGDHVASYEAAIAAGWTGIEPAPVDSPTSHFQGVCPDCRKLFEDEEASH